MKTPVKYVVQRTTRSGKIDFLDAIDGGTEYIGNPRGAWHMSREEADRRLTRCAQLDPNSSFLLITARSASMRHLHGRRRLAKQSSSS